MQGCYRAQRIIGGLREQHFGSACSSESHCRTGPGRGCCHHRCQSPAFLLQSGYFCHFPSPKPCCFFHDQKAASANKNSRNSPAKQTCHPLPILSYVSSGSVSHGWVCVVGPNIQVCSLTEKEIRKQVLLLLVLF